MLLHALLNLLVSGRIVSPIAITNMLGPDRAATGQSRSSALALVTESARIAAESTRFFILHPSRRVGHPPVRLRAGRP